MLHWCIGNCLFIFFWLTCKLEIWRQDAVWQLHPDELLKNWPPKCWCKIIAKEFRTSQKEAKLTLTGLRPGRMWAGLAGSLGFSATGGLWIDWLVKNHELLGEENITCSQWGCSDWWSCPASLCKTPVITMLRRRPTRSTCRPRLESTSPSLLARTQRGSSSHKTSHPGRGL